MNTTLPANTLPDRITDTDSLDDVLSRPSAELVKDLEKLDGDILILGAGGKMGPTLARLAKRAAPQKRVIAAARFTSSSLREQLESWGIECLTCDLLDRSALERLPQCANVVFMAGHKFGSAANASYTWATNCGMPYLVAERYRDSRIAVFSTACVYPFVDATGPGTTEDIATRPPPGDYAASCVGREQMFLHGSLRYGTPGRLLRLSYAIDLRYGVLHDVALNVMRGEPVDVSMGFVNLIWQGDANEQALRALKVCTTPTSALNVSGPKVSVRWLAREFGSRFGKLPNVVGQESPTAWLVDTSSARQLFGPPRVPLESMIDWVADWVENGRPSWGKKTHFEVRDGKY